MKQKKFLTAQWLRLIMANYLVEPEVLKPFLPAKTELDSWNNKTYVSLVGFLFHDTCVRNVRFPFHTTFPEVNLRFYVRYKENDEYKRGVVFIKEIVPRPAITFIANYLFNERYVTLPMKSFVNITPQQQHIGYHWKFKNHWNKLEVHTGLKKYPIQPGSEEEFITEHFWGYSAISKTMTGEYQVEHPGWDVFPVEQYKVDCDFEKLYGPAFSALNGQTPVSVFLAEGSAISVYSKRAI
ncbi:DUF2071 domain-containing protein [Niastella caeni]|uniref:DUF2071 domain-containing protein n=1 Tax=Niastella caeni TaxID=2569763 RepID=A0A4S8HXP8_9BACT|nr:DUF2071 domain-containing protein [Niastella caeni]THU38012.1 DUF2071 domain-containing protein [Niastella caeni]